MTIVNKDGSELLDQTLHTEFDRYPNLYSHRGGIQKKLFDHAVGLGVNVLFGTSVVEVTEDPDSVHVSAGGKSYTADCLIAADGVHSRTRSHVIGSSDRPKKSGFAVYRSWFPLDLLRGDPLTRSIAESEEPLFKIWIGEDTHAILTTNTSLQSVTCFVTHKVR